MCRVCLGSTEFLCTEFTLKLFCSQVCAGTWSEGVPKFVIPHPLLLLKWPLPSSSPKSRAGPGSQRPGFKLCEWVQITAFPEPSFLLSCGRRRHFDRFRL